MDKWIVVYSLSQSSYSNEHEQTIPIKMSLILHPQCWAKEARHKASAVHVYLKFKHRQHSLLLFKVGMMATLWGDMVAGMGSKVFPRVLETVCLLIWVLVTWVSSVYENYQPVNMWFLHFSVHWRGVHFNNNHFLKSRWRKRPQWKSLIRMS